MKTRNKTLGAITQLGVGVQRLQRGIKKISQPTNRISLG